jgi:hypothetical protein
MDKFRGGNDAREEEDREEGCEEAGEEGGQEEGEEVTSFSSA